jgi:PKD repeat protein
MAPRWFPLVLGAIVLFMAGSATAQTNLLTNGGFETGQVSPWQGASGAQVVGTAAHSGAYGVRLPSAQLLNQGWISVTPGKTYVVTGWFRWAAYGGTDWGYDVFDVINSNWQTIVTVTNLASRYPQNTWVNLALTFTPTTSSVQVRLGVYGPKATVDQSWDDIRLFEKVGNQTPTVAPTATPTSGNAPLAVAFQAHASDPDGAVAQYQWDFGDGSVGTTEAASHTFTQKGTHTVKLKVWDNDGATAAQSVTISVLTDGNPTVSISQPTTQDTFTTSGGSITLSGAASAPSGRTIQSLVWDNVNTDEAGIVSVSPGASIGWNAGTVALKPGSNEILVTATDSSGRVSTDRLIVTRTFGPPVLDVVSGAQASVRVYEKQEIAFDVATVADDPFFQYDPAPPLGVRLGTGVTVEGVITTPSGSTVVHPAFVIGETVKDTTSAGQHWYETGRTHWMLRYSPQTTGVHQVILRATDANGTTSVSAGSFTATAPSGRGYIGVSQDDPRYFEYSSRDLFVPTGPAWGNDYASYRGTGINLERPWMGAQGAYSTNWAKWMRIDMPLANEGIESPLTSRERYPSHELSREIVHPGGRRIWMGQWMDEPYFPDLKPGVTYQIKLRLKAVGIAGPASAGVPFGFMVKTHGFPGASIETDLRARPSIVPVVTQDREWHTTVTRYVAGSSDGQGYLSLLLDNVSAGSVYIDQFSIRPVLGDGSLGGEMIRHSRADMHTYVEQRPSAFFDWQVEQGEANGVFLKYVVQDKNDWVPRHMSAFGVFSDAGDGYFQPKGTRIRWLQEQWWRYIVARWGYSPAVHSWESCNEADPNDVSVWRHTQDFAAFLHQTNAHPQMATTSFWCCWKPEFWSDKAKYPDVDYADLHEYTKDSALGLDMVEWVLNWAQTTAQQPAGKPVIMAETGIGYSGQSYFEHLKKPNTGVWYHNLLWSQLNGLSGMSVPNYWWSEHFAVIDRKAIARPFYQFVSGLDINRGGYVDAAASSTNGQIRVLGQKNQAKGSAYLWVQNRLHNWHNVMGVENPTTVTAQSGTITLRMSPNAQYTIDRWNTYTGALVSTQAVTSNGSGEVAYSVSGLADDFALRVYGPSTASPKPPTSVVVK